MLCVIFTLDYEIHGNGEGDPYALMVEPTARMMDLFEKYGAKLTIMADIGEILKFKQYKEQFGRDDYHYDAIADQLRDAIRRGHDVQLHIHSSYFNAKYDQGRWIQDWSEYNFAGLPFPRMREMIGTGKEFLENLLRPVDSEYACVAFRAANWSVSPSANVVRALIENDIKIDSSVFKDGRRNGIVSFDYSNAPHNLRPWPVDEQDICKPCRGSALLEVPIYCERRWLGSFASSNRFYRAALGSFHRVQTQPGNTSAGRKTFGTRLQRLLRVAASPFRRFAWKADFNQCTGNQLVRTVARIQGSYTNEQTPVPFVLIGHSKIFTRWNERSLQPFLRFVASEGPNLGYGRFTDLDSQALAARPWPHLGTASAAAPNVQQLAVG